MDFMIAPLFLSLSLRKYITQALRISACFYQAAGGSWASWKKNLDAWPQQRNFPVSVTFQTKQCDKYIFLVKITIQLNSGLNSNFYAECPGNLAGNNDTIRYDWSGRQP